MTDQPNAEDSIYGPEGTAPGLPSRGSQDGWDGPYDPPEKVPVDAEGDEPQAQAEPVEEGIPTFPEEHREKFVGLLYLGRLEDSLTWAGHTFVVRTLTSGEHIIAGMLVKPYLGTRIEGRAWQAAIVACGIELADGQPIYDSLGPEDEMTVARKKMDYILKHWYPSTVNALHSKISELDILAREALEAMGKASG